MGQVLYCLLETQRWFRVCFCLFVCLFLNKVSIHSPRKERVMVWRDTPARMVQFFPALEFTLQTERWTGRQTNLKHVVRNLVEDIGVSGSFSVTSELDLEEVAEAPSPHFLK